MCGRPELVQAIEPAAAENDEVQKAEVCFGQSTVAAEALRFVDALPTVPKR